MIGRIIMEMRKSAGFNQKELSNILGIAQTTLSGYETNNSMPNFDTVFKIAKICDFDIAFIDKNSGEIKKVEI